MEVWKEIPSCPGYEVSNIGNIRTNKPRNRNAVGGEYRIIKPAKAKNGYMRFQCWDKGICKNLFVHRVALEAFIGPCPDGWDTCHNNGIRDDNRIENLRWDTKSNNTKDVFKHGKHVFMRPGFSRRAIIIRHHGVDFYNKNYAELQKGI